MKKGYNIAEILQVKKESVEQIKVLGDTLAGQLKEVVTLLKEVKEADAFLCDKIVELITLQAE